MQITVKLFGSIREAAGAKELAVAGANATVATDGLAAEVAAAISSRTSSAEST